MSDRWGWSQWLAWLPSFVAVGSSALGFLAAWRPAKSTARRKRVITWAALLLLTGCYFAFLDNRLLRSEPHVPDDALRIVHWNASPSERGDRRAAIDLALDLDADVTVLTDAHLIAWRQRANERIGDSAHIAATRPFAFISRLPILEMRPLVAVDEIYAALLRIDASETSFGRELRLLAIDLPSDLSLSRMEVARRLSDLLDEAGSAHRDADLIVGDFNITRRSRSLTLLAPNMHHAWNEAGRGFSATYPREWAMVHIDHIFINPQTLRAVDYEILNLDVARHRAQRLIVEPR